MHPGPSEERPTNLDVILSVSLFFGVLVDNAGIHFFNDTKMSMLETEEHSIECYKLRRRWDV